MTGPDDLIHLLPVLTPALDRDMPSDLNSSLMPVIFIMLPINSVDALLAIFINSFYQHSAVLDRKYAIKIFHVVDIYFIEVCDYEAFLYTTFFPQAGL